MSVQKFTDNDAALILKMDGIIDKERTIASIICVGIEVQIKRISDGYLCKVFDDEYIIEVDEKAETIYQAIDKALTSYIQQYNIVGDAVRAIRRFQEKMESDDNE